MSELQFVINQKIQSGNESICKSCVHRFVCRAYVNQPCIECNHFLTARHVRWERKEDPYGFFDTIPVYSVCDCTTKLKEEYLYCPNCGARMDGGGDA